MQVITERTPEWINWIAPERFNDYDLFRIVIFSCFIHHVLVCHLCAKHLKNTVGKHRGKTISPKSTIETDGVKPRTDFSAENMMRWIAL